MQTIAIWNKSHDVIEEYRSVITVPDDSGIKEMTREYEIVITFKNNEFKECRYNMSGMHDLVEWKILGEISKEIFKLVELKGGK